MGRSSKLLDKREGGTVSKKKIVRPFGSRVSKNKGAQAPSLNPPLYILCHKRKSFPFFLMFVLEHVSLLHFLGKQNSSKCPSFAWLILVELGFQCILVL